MEPYVHEDDNGNMLTIYSEGDRAGMTICGEAADDPLRVFPEDFAKIAEALAKRCGLPSPVILNRSSARFPDDGSLFRFGDFGFRLYPEGVAPSLPGIEAKVVPAAALRELAAHLVALADQAEAEPDPAEVDELAAAIRAERASHDALPLPPAIDKLSARTALRWMNAKSKHA
jgi:hypothetical protein